MHPPGDQPDTTAPPPPPVTAGVRGDGRRMVWWSVAVPSVLAAALGLLVAWWQGLVAVAVLCAPIVWTAWRRGHARWIDVAAAAAVGSAAMQAAMAARIVYLQEVVDPFHGWAGLLLIYTVPVVAAAAAAWGGRLLHRSRRSMWWLAAVLPAALVWSILVAWAGTAIGGAIVDAVTR